jgi:hypothetical protein
MRLYMVRRTRSFIQENYADTDPNTGRRYLTFADGTRSYFPTRQPKTVTFTIDDNDPRDQYALLYSSPVVDAINALTLPRYGLGNYLKERPHEPPTAAEARIIADLARAGKRLMGFCRTNLFKRLESSGQAFLQSIQRHILRNFVYLHALENDQPLPIGTQDASLLDARITDADRDLFAPEEDEDSNHQEPDVLRRSIPNTPGRSRGASAGSVPTAFCRNSPGTSALIAPPCWRCCSNAVTGTPTVMPSSTGTAQLLQSSPSPLKPGASTSPAGSAARGYAISFRPERCIRSTI